MKRVLSLVQMTAAAVVAGRLRAGADRLPPLLPVEGDLSQVSVIVPARNEALRIRRCVEAILRNQGVLEVIVVDDSSDDHTAQIAGRAGAKVVSAPRVPPGWVGKPWALQQGLQAARGETVAFVDADVVVKNGALAALINQLRHYSVVSASGRMVTNSPATQMLSASMLTTLVYRYGPVGRRDQVPLSRTIGNGQFWAMRRADLKSRGGFAPIASHMTDDIALFRHLRKSGLRVAFLDGSRLFDVEMYSGAKETWREWPRSLPMNDVTSVSTRAVDAATVALTMALPGIRVATHRAKRLDYALLAQRSLLSAALWSSYRPRRFVMLSPLVDVPVVGRLIAATVKPVRRWRGREYR
jgi:dolichol-phosphate mannosyltransferase